ncbi:MAG: flavin reductase family protein [Anaerolineales bacterium]|nr:flavin reductase family protein [Anaerolineales bacterium]
MQQQTQPEAIFRPDPAQLREVLRFWTTGVTIVSAAHQGRRHGMTVNSFTSLSLEPPLVSISLEKVTRTHELVSQVGRFGVSLLRASQQELSNRFAGRESEQQDRFADVATFTLETGSPLLQEALAYFDCRVAVTHDAGTHTIFISEVLAAGAPQGAASEQPLVYFNRGYRKIG